MVRFSTIVAKFSTKGKKFSTIGVGFSTLFCEFSTMNYEFSTMNFLLGTSLINISGAPTVENPHKKIKQKNSAIPKRYSAEKNFHICYWQIKLTIDKSNQLSYKIFHSTNTINLPLNTANQITNLPSSQAQPQKFST